MLGEMTSEDKSSINADTMQRTLDTKGETVSKIASVKRAKDAARHLKRGLAARRGASERAEAPHHPSCSYTVADASAATSSRRGESMSGNV